MKQRVWKKPQLVVLLRGKPGEGVLVACKTTMLSDTPANGHEGCDEDPGCVDCNTWAIS